MTYVELIVVLSIFSIMSGVLLFGYGDYGKQVDVQNLSQEIALQIVGAQKMSVSGKLLSPDQEPVLTNFAITSWKPSYGVYFSTSNPISNNSTEANPVQFIPFFDASNIGYYGLDYSCGSGSGSSIDLANDECTDIIKLGKGDKITCLFAGSSTVTACDSNNSIHDLSIVFTRPNSGANIVISPTSLGGSTPQFEDKAIIVISNQDNPNIHSTITVLSSGVITVD
ncbi:MAG: type II secretion system protein [Candidatus Nomurabacteria bacterium]|nr:type II secretion system protein [Candidatus Nomurabacteria bacterium]